ncbi:MAG TPA: hypothetical protein VMU94_28595 [Streptosporangiaceae bacterium]|nr:hypothetical protein [Streptosporangiaceae bacterium]
MDDPDETIDCPPAACRGCGAGLAGWMAGIRGKSAPAVHADETPARAAGGTRYLHLACTRYLTCLHTGGRCIPDSRRADRGPRRRRGRTPR